MLKLAKKRVSSNASESNISVEFKAMDACDLSSLENHMKAIKETARVLRPGGVACWGIWGDESESTLFGVLPAAMKACGIDTPKRKTRSNFHMQKTYGDDGLRKLLLSEGFDKCIVFHVKNSLACLDGDEFQQKWLQVVGSRIPILKTLSKEKTGELRKAIAGEVERTLSSGRPLCLDTTVIVARKS
eukprot:jgi/Bigna1/146685/aug1.119_g21393